MRAPANFEEIDMQVVYEEYDLYTLDILAEKLFGIKNLSENADKIKEFLGSQEPKEGDNI